MKGFAEGLCFDTLVDERAQYNAGSNPAQSQSHRRVEELLLLLSATGGNQVHNVQPVVEADSILFRVPLCPQGAWSVRSVTFHSVRKQAYLAFGGQTIPWRGRSWIEVLSQRLILIAQRCPCPRTDR